jgi:hypothetical protein
MAWEIENTVTTDNKTVQPQWEIEESKPLTQSVMDAETQQMYNVPLGMDATDAKFAIDTQHGGKNKDSFFGKVWTGTQIVGESIEEVFDDFNRAVVEHAGQLVDSLVLDKGLRYQKRMKLVEDWENGDWSYFGDKEFSDEEKQNIIRRQKEKIAYIQNLRERTQKFFNKGAQIMRPDEKLDNADKFFIAASSGIVSTAEAAAVALATKNPTVAAAAIGTTYAALKDTEYFDKAVAAGESANDASTDATVAGAIEGGLEFVGDRLLLGIGKVKPIQQLGNKVISSSIAKTLKSKVGRSAIGKIASRHPQSIFGAAVKGAVTEGGEEFMQEGAGMLWENYNDVSSYSMDEILSQSLFAFAAGSVSGAGMGGVGTSIYNQKITKDNTAIKNILKENTPELTDEELQVVADNVQEALLQQGAAYDEQITNLLRKESEVDVMPDGLTAESLTADTRAMLKEKYGMSDEDINKTIDIAANYIDARNGFNETYNEYFDKMDVAGYDRTVADNAARVLAARAVAIARAEGVSTEEVRKRWNLNLTRQSYEDFKNGVPVTDNYALRQRQIDDIMNVVPENWTPEQKKALRKGIAARARYGDLDKANFNAETAKQWFETKGAEESVKAINKRVQTIMGVLNFKEEVENVKKSKRLNPQNVNPFEALVDDKLYNKIARIEKENKGDSLITFIVKRGGLKDVGGELKNMDAQKQRIGLINNKSGNSFDDIALAAWEHGYFPSHSERPTINDLLEAIDAELFGKKRYQYQEGNPFSMTEYVNSLAEQMDMLGVDYRGMTAEEAEAAYNKAAEEYSKNAKQYESEYTNTGENFDDFTLFHEAVELADKISKIDADRLEYERKDINPELKGRENEKVKAVKINRFFADRENSESVSLDDVIAALDTKVKANEKGMRVLKNSARGETVTLSNKALHKMFNTTTMPDNENIGGILGKECIANIADIFDSAILVKTHSDEKHESKNKIRRYANVIQSQKDNDSPAETFIVKITVKELANGNKDLTDIEIEENGGRELAAYDLKVGRKNTAGNSLRNFAKADKTTVAHNSGNDTIINDLIEFVNTYTAKSININGKERSATNSDGNRIAKTEEGLRAFYKWFGDSKVVDADGKPLVVYHGTNKKFREFDKGAIGKKHKNLYQGKGFYFTKEYYDAQNYGKTIMPVYLKIENPALSDYNLKPENDGISAAHGVWVAFEPNQIKSTLNRGSFSESTNDIYLQGAISDEQLEADLAEFDKILDSFAADNAEYYDKKDKYNAARKIKKKYQDFFMYNIADASNPYGRHDPFYFEYDGKKDFTNIFVPKKLEKGSSIILYRGAEQVFVPVAEFDENKFKKLGYKRQKKFAEGLRDVYTLNKDETNDRAYFQSAFAGSRVDYDKPSLEAIGTGEGNQVHGWGLYYALNRDVAESYRKAFLGTQSSSLRIQDKSIGDFLKGLDGFIGYYDGALLLLENNPDMNPREYFIKALNEYIIDFKKNYQRTNIDTFKKCYEKAEAIKAKAEKLTDDDFTIKQWGQVHEVDLPENPYLLDEQKSFNEQSDIVKKALTRLANDYDDLNGNNKFKDILLKEEQTGKQIYALLSALMDDSVFNNSSYIAVTSKGNKEASKQLNAYGIKGITYNGKQDGRCFVIFNPDDVRVVQKFYQETAGNNVPPRGAFVERGDENIIFAFENADASTVIHELGHFFLHDMQKFADNPKTAEQLAEIYKYLGVENGTLTREQEEKFADTFEVYLLDGRAPNQILRGVFARFKKWISNLWYEVKRLSGINITDEVRATFDEMLGGKGLDFAMQASTLKMGQMLERGNISQWQTNRAMQMLYEGKMSKADMQNLIQQLRNGMKNKEFVEALKEFENKPANSNKEVLTEWDYTVLRNQLDGLNFNRDNVKARIEKLLKWSEPRTSGGKLVGRFPNKQLNDAFARYRELATMNKDEAKQKLQENVELIEDQMKSGGDVDIEQLIFENRLLSYNLNKISNSELLKLYDGLAESYNMGRLTDKITGDAKRERKKQMIERAKNVLTNYGAINPNIESSELKKRLARFGMSQQSWNGLLDTLSMNDERTQTGKSAILQDLEMFEAEQKKYAGIAADSELISQKLEKALSGTMNNAQSVTHYMNTELDKKVVIEWSGLIDPKERNPKYQKWQAFKRTFTKDQLIDIYMKSLDDDTREIMINDPVNQYNQAFLNKVKDELTTDDLAVADAIFEFYNENYERFNAFYEEHFGMSLPKSKYYTPRAMSVDGVTIDDKTTHGYASFSGAKKRVAVAGTGVINIQGAFRALNKYINQQNHYMGYMDKLTDINAVLANKDVKNIINSLFGAEMNKRIAYEINNLANNGNDKVDAWGKFWNKLRANYAKSVLAVKPSLAIKQLTSFPAYWENVGTKDFIAGVADFFAHPKEAIKTLGGTTLMKTRGTDIIRDFDQISKSDLFTKMKKAKGKIKWNDLLMFNIKFGDRGAIYMGGWALYKSELNKNLKAGMSEKEAKAKALEAFERITDETQQSGRLSQQSYMQSNSLWRAFTMFTSSQNQYLRKEINAIRGLATGRMSKAKAAKTIFIYHVLLPVFFQVVSDGFRWDKDNDLRAAVLGSLNGWFILNKVLENVYNWITDNGNMFKTRMSVRDLVPFWGSVEDLKNDLLKFADDEMELEDVLDVIKPIGEVTGLPLKYAKDVVENAGEYADEGEYGKELLLWLGWSPYSLRDSDDE